MVSSIGGNMGVSGPTYNWSNGIAGANDTIAYSLCAGNYTVTAIDTNGCFSTAPFTIAEPPQLIIDSVIAVDETCPGDCDGSINVHDPLGYQYSYDGGQTFTQFSYANNLCPGTYSIVMQDINGCEALATGVVGSPPQVVAGFISDPDTALTNDTYVQFFNTSIHATDFAWDIAGLSSDTALNTAYLFPDALGATYDICLTAWDANGCEDEFCAQLIVLDVLQMWVPNAFTPDGTGVNETFGPVFNGEWIGEYEFLIFNRWGELVFESGIPGHFWDGRYKGALAQEGVYVWQVVYKDLRTREKERVFGHVTLLR